MVWGVFVCQAGRLELEAGWSPCRLEQLGAGLGQEGCQLRGLADTGVQAAVLPAQLHSGCWALDLQIMPLSQSNLWLTAGRLAGHTVCHACGSGCSALEQTTIENCSQ